MVSEIFQNVPSYAIVLGPLAICVMVKQAVVSPKGSDKTPWPLKWHSLLYAAFSCVLGTLTGARG